MSEVPDEAVVRRFLELVKDFSGYEIERMLEGITQNDVSRWRRGEFTRVSKAKRRALVRFIEDEDVRRELKERVAEIPRVVRESRQPYSTDADALELFGNLDDVVRHLRGVAPPGQAKARKLAAVEGIERTATALGWQLPDWFFDLRRQIEDGEL